MKHLFSIRKIQLYTFSSVYLIQWQIQGAPSSSLRWTVFFLEGEVGGREVIAELRLMVFDMAATVCTQHNYSTSMDTSLIKMHSL